MPRENAHLLAVGGRDAGALLTTVLQRVQAERGQIGSFGVTENPKDAALVFKLSMGRSRFALAG